MGSQSGEVSMVIGSGSSIAILQERFKQLERIREKREEKELLQLFGSHADKASISPCSTGITLLELSIMPQQHHHQLKPVTEVRDSLSLELHCWKNFKHGENRGEVKNLLCPSPDRSDIGLNKFSRDHESFEVDTTLHL